MISVNEAVELILKKVSPQAGEEVTLVAANGRVLFENVRAQRSLPVILLDDQGQGKGEMGF